MSITKSYNKQTGIYYAYETIYEWSDEKQKKVQHKRCIGQFDPETGEVVPNGKVGRPSLSKQKRKSKKSADSVAKNANSSIDAYKAADLLEKLARLETKADDLSKEIHEVLTDVRSLTAPDI